MSYLTDTIRPVCPLLNNGKVSIGCDYDSKWETLIANGTPLCPNDDMRGRCGLGCYGASKRIVTYDNARILLF